MAAAGTMKTVIFAVANLAVVEALGTAATVSNLYTFSHAIASGKTDVS